ncbi:MAG TPA: hypothetical protein DHU26_03285 [Spirochaetaceae bacterium]|nr:hypothetical protein [Spirochaetaceae bacterium]
MRYRKGAPLTNDTPFSRLIWDILIALIALVGWPISRAFYRIKIGQGCDATSSAGMDEGSPSRLNTPNATRTSPIASVPPKLPSPAILVSNHCMPLDPLFHGLAIFPRRTFFTLLEETCEAPVLGSFVRLLGGIPLPRDRARLNDIEQAVAHALSTRGLIHFYPEGECFLGNQNIYPFKGGAFYFAIKFGAPVVPIVTVLKKRAGHSTFRGQKSSRIQVTVHVLNPIQPPACGATAHETLARAIRFSNQVQDLMQAEIERCGGDKSLYRGPMPRIKGVND